MRLFPLFGLLLLSLPAQAVVVRGKVTSPLGVPLAGVRVQLIQGRRSIADTISAPDGTYEIRTAYSGRFLLLTSPSGPGAGFAPQIGSSFYGGRSDLLNLDVALNGSGITPQLSAQANRVVTPTRQLATPATQVAADQLLTHANPILELAPAPGSFVLQQGPIGAPATLYLRGAPPATLLATINGVTANPFGGAVNLSSLATTGIAAISSEPALELTPTANPLYLTGASGGVLTADPAHGQGLVPALVYSGDAGNQHTYRNEAVATWARGRFDLLGAFSRFNIAPNQPAAPYHLTSYAANLGYHISAGTSLRINGRYDRSAAPLTSPYQFFLVTPDGREAAQNLFASATFDTSTVSRWHNLLRFGLARTRAQTLASLIPATGLPVTITGANGATATGNASFIPLAPREDTATDRNEGTYQTDYSISHHLQLAGEFRFQHNRAADTLPGVAATLVLNHYAGAIGLRGDLLHRIFYEASGSLDHSPLYGLTGSPRIGLVYAPVRPNSRKFHGTTLHATASTGSRDPSLRELDANPVALRLPRSRTFDASIAQNLIGQKLILRATYFHSQFSHEYEPIALTPGDSHPVLSQTLDLRTQGAESVLHYQPFRRVALDAGYNYLAALTEHSGAPANTNPDAPLVAVGGLTALAGARPFHRPPHSGFFTAQYSGTRLNATLHGTFASKSDDSTGLLQTPTLLLPNHNLTPGYLAMNGNVSLILTRHFTAFTELSNLTDNRHIAPIGFTTSPFLVRAGLRIWIGGE